MHASFGRYRLLERLGQGGMAEVFKAKLYGVGGFEKVVALKRILPQHAQNASFIKMFIEEAKIAGQLSHDAGVTADGSSGSPFFHCATIDNVPSRYCCRQAKCWILPLEVLGRLRSRISTMASTTSWCSAATV